MCKFFFNSFLKLLFLSHFFIINVSYSQTLIVSPMNYPDVNHLVSFLRIQGIPIPIAFSCQNDESLIFKKYPKSVDIECASQRKLQQFIKTIRIHQPKSTDHAYTGTPNELEGSATGPFRDADEVASEAEDSMGSPNEFEGSATGSLQNLDNIAAEADGLSLEMGDSSGSPNEFEGSATSTINSSTKSFSLTSIMGMVEQFSKELSFKVWKTLGN